ncbi:hypothetical protein Selin_2146 [Desulfurispirillum indicum S5]|uniref:Lipoprotein n=2 Tax=Desulfurispirillum TaxID=393029 RepID=E6W3B2_DESIS|nr:hypothetical protein Selin_2146 [Desulfurispirillum indicum S5]
MKSTESLTRILLAGAVALMAALLVIGCGSSSSDGDKKGSAGLDEAEWMATNFLWLVSEYQNMAPGIVGVVEALSEGPLDGVSLMTGDLKEDAIINFTEFSPDGEQTLSGSLQFRASDFNEADEPAWIELTLNGITMAYGDEFSVAYDGTLFLEPLADERGTLTIDMNADWEANTYSLEEVVVDRQDATEVTGPYTDSQYGTVEWQTVAPLYDGTCGPSSGILQATAGAGFDVDFEVEFYADEVLLRIYDGTSIIGERDISEILYSMWGCG